MLAFDGLYDSDTLFDSMGADIVNTAHLRDDAMATTFWLSVSYNFGCAITSGTICDSRRGFTG